MSHDSGSLSGGDETSSEPNNSCSDLSEELQTAFREEIEEDSGREKMLRVSQKQVLNQFSLWMDQPGHFLFISFLLSNISIEKTVTEKS